MHLSVDPDGLAAKVKGGGAGTANLFLQLQDAVEEGLCCGWTPRNINVDGHDAITAANNRIRVVIVAPAIGATPHADDVAWNGHLIVDLAEGGGHFVGEGPCNDHDVALSGAGTEDDPKAILIVAADGHMHHFDGTAGQSKGHGPHASCTNVPDDLVHGGGHIFCAILWHHQWHSIIAGGQGGGGSIADGAVMANCIGGLLHCCYVPQAAEKHILEIQIPPVP